MTSKKLLCSVSILIFFLLAGTSNAEYFDDSKVKIVTYPAWFKTKIFLDLDEDLKLARSQGKIGLMVYFGTEGCSYCEVFLRKSLGNPELAAIVQKNFDTIGFDIFDDEEMTSPQGKTLTVKEFAKKEGVQFSPSLLFYGQDGKRILRVAGYQSPERFAVILKYLINKHYLKESFRDYLKRGKIKTPSTLALNLKQDPLFSKPPYALDRSRIAAGHPLLVVFEKKACKECDEFHAKVLSFSGIRKTLQNFEVVRLDAEDFKTPLITPSGGKMSPAIWFDRSNLTRTPAFLFFNEQGNEVLRIDSLVLRQRLQNSLDFVLERAYKKNWTYQRFARSKAFAKNKEAINK